MNWRRNTGKRKRRGRKALKLFYNLEIFFARFEVASGAAVKAKSSDTKRNAVGESGDFYSFFANIGKGFFVAGRKDAKLFILGI